MTVLVLSEHDVRELLDMESCVEAMTEVLTELARGELFQPLRFVGRPPNANGLMGLMPAARTGANAAYSLKEIVVTPANPARGLDAHQGSVLLHDGETGQLLAVLNASPVTEIRTAAVSAVATRALARRDASRVAILGAGVQARAHVEAMRVVLDDPEIRIWSRRLEAAEALAARRRRHRRALRRRGAARRRGGLHDDDLERADRGAALARRGRPRQRRRIERADRA